jgi:hypothetical protein
LTVRRTPSRRTVENIYLAGSVLPADFRWDEMIKNGQVKRVASQCGSVDWPVGWLCRSLNMIFFKDVGTGGYDGFTYLNAADQMKWFDGGHGSPLARRNQPYIARYYWRRLIHLRRQCRTTRTRTLKSSDRQTSRGGFEPEVPHDAVPPS